MTTAFGIPEVFWAVDSRWSYKGQDKSVDNYPIKKYLFWDGELHIFAGDECPIILEQAMIMDLITQFDFILLTGYLLDQAFEIISLSERDGGLLGNYGHTYSKGNLFFIGSGGHYACEFLYWATKKRYKSITRCNILGALHYAKYKDIATGGRDHVKLWKNKKFYSEYSQRGFEFAISEYQTLIKDKVNTMLKNINNSDQYQANLSGSLKSDYNCGGSAGITKVSVSAAVKRLQERETRKKARQSSANY